MAGSCLAMVVSTKIFWGSASVGPIVEPGWPSLCADGLRPLIGLLMPSWPTSLSDCALASATARPWPRSALDVKARQRFAACGVSDGESVVAGIVEAQRVGTRSKQYFANLRGALLRRQASAEFCPCCPPHLGRRLFGCEGRSQSSRWRRSPSLEAVSKAPLRDSTCWFIPRALALGERRDHVTRV